MARTLIKRGRTWRWLMHLQVAFDCQSVFAAAGHFNYLRSAYTFLQQLSHLEETNPDVFRQFVDGFLADRSRNQF
ncbi:hypothetical protein DPMN_106478 [Dreissena polymorpha]|uniref:Uncharacterized protein n=1 Tax=Dreissena polymorpha TaxID=45954 RepID=A0A9D4QIU9_DREPO|nr:hypothetical protein DPMN_106478 [Dreissena polymorpha]